MTKEARPVDPQSVFCEVCIRSETSRKSTAALDEAKVLICEQAGLLTL